MTLQERESLLRRYADGTIAWHTLRHLGFENYVEVLAGLGALGLRQPKALMTGPNVELRQRGLAFLQRAMTRKSNV